MTEDLDTRARSAAEGLRGAVADVPVPTMASATPRPRRAPLVLAAAALVAVAALVAALVVVGADDDTEVATGPTSPSGGVPRLVLDPVPDGLEPTGAADLPYGDAGVHQWIYGEPAADDPLAGGGVSILVSPGTRRALELDAALAAGGSAAEVAGKPAAVGPDRLHAGRRQVVVDVDGTGTIVVASDVLPDSDLLSVAAMAVVEGAVDDPAAVPSTLPGDLSLLGGGPWNDGLYPPLPDAQGHLVGYQAPDDRQGTIGLPTSVSVAVVEGDGADLASLRWSLGLDRSEAVRGTVGWAGAATEGPDGSILVWQESSDAIGVLWAVGSVDAAVALAESLRPATDEEWAALLPSPAATPGTAGMPSVGETVAPSGARAAVSSSEGSTSWVAYLDGQGALCLDVFDEASSTLTCAALPLGGPEPLTVAVGALPGGRFVVYGATTVGSSTDVIRGEGRDPGFSVAYPVEGGAVFAAEVVAAEVPSAVVVEDPVTGRALARAAVPPPPPPDGS